MTATIKVLESAEYHFKDINLEYRTQGGDSPGRWSGKGAASLRLSGTVEKLPFQRLLAGQHPRMPKALVQFGRKKHRPGFDVTFQVPKTLSAYWAVADEHIRIEIEAAIDRAVRSVLQWLEEQIPLTRRGKGGAVRELAKLIIAEFDHVQNRNGDPLLHRHVVFANVCERDDGTWGSLDSKTLYSWIRTLGPMFRANLANQLRESLGLELIDAVDDDKQLKGWFEVAGVPESLADQWSSRRKEMLAALEGRGHALGNSSARARANATLATRKAKEELVPREQLHAQWRQEAAKHGFTPARAAKLLGQAYSRPRSNAYAKAWEAALKDITKFEAYFTERRLIQEVCERLQTGHFNGVDIAERVRKDLAQSTEIIPLMDAAADKQFTTREMWELETKLFKDLRTMQSRPGAQVSAKQVEKVLRNHPKLDGEQSAAVRQLLTSKGANRTLTGIAGAGKSTALAAAAEGFEAEGYRVHAVALAGIAKEELARKTGIRAYTVTRFESELSRSHIKKAWDHSKHVVRQYARAARGKSTWVKDEIKFDQKSVLFVDESGMVGTRPAASVVQQALKAGATIVWTGDERQLQPIEAGMPFQKIAATTPRSHLSINRRQKDPQDQQAVHSLREGDAAQAIKSYVDRGRVTIGRDKRDTIQKLVETWTAEGGTRRPEQFAVFVQTKAEAREVNGRCQAARLEAARTPHLANTSNGEERFYRGDRVLFHKAARLYGGIENGTRGTILSVDPIRAEAKIRLDETPLPSPARKSPSPIVTVPVKKFGKNISLGYACTTHKAQGQTVPNALVLMGGDMLDRELAYVQATRAKEKTLLFIDQSHAGDKLQDLIAAVERSRPKTMAHDHARPATKPDRSPTLERELTREP